MRFFKPDPAGGYEWVNFGDFSIHETLVEIGEPPQLASWKKPRAKLVPVEEDAPCQRSDFPWLGSHALVLRQEPAMRLRDMLEANGELLPMDGDDGTELFAFNAQVVDALDEERSDVARFSSGEILEIRKPVFRTEALRDVDIFRLPGRGGETFVSERFVQRVQEAGLQGLSFLEVWSS
jgi:hypothetical protein